MRVLFLSPSGALGGAERVLLENIWALRHASPPVEVHLLSLAPGPVLEEAARRGAKVCYLPVPQGIGQLGDSQFRQQGLLGRFQGLLSQVGRAIPGLGRYLWGLRRTVDQIRPDLIHSNGIKTHLLSALAVGRSRPVIWHAHDFYGSRPVVRRLLQAVHGQAVGVIAISQAVARDVHLVLPRRPIGVLANAIDLERFTPGAGEDRDWLDQAAGLSPLPPGGLRVGIVATYARWKGQDLLLKAIGQLDRSMLSVPVRFYIIGGPIYQTQGSQFTRTELEELAASLGVASEVGFVEFQPDPTRAYQALDVVVHTSTQPEPFGLTIIEAMACGRAVVAATAGGVPELFRDGIDALGCIPNDPAALAQVLGALLQSSHQRQQLGEAATAWVHRHFDRSRLQRELPQIYQAFLQR